MPDVSVEYHNDNIAIVSINNPPVNAASHSIRSGLRNAIAETEQNDACKIVVLICEGRTFIAGADIREFDQPPKEPTLPELTLALEGAKKTWISAIHGTALGGGLEIALCCHYRILHSKARMGLPEVNLGLIPGAGGTVRLPRVISMHDALDMITSGKPIPSDKALASGLIHGIFDGEVREAALDFAAKINPTEKPTSIISRSYVNPMSKLEIDAFRAKLIKKTRGQIAPLIAFDMIVDGLKTNAFDQLNSERESFQKLKSNAQSSALRYIFSAERTATKLKLTNDITPNSIGNVGVIGGGTMGAGIACAVLLSGRTVTMIEQDIEAAQTGKDRVMRIMGTSLKRGIISQDHHNELIANFTSTDNYNALSNADLVIEAVFEDMAIKKAVFAKLDQTVPSSALLASNTSYLDINDIAQTTRNPSRVLGLHFFSPAHIMKLVEVIRTQKTSDDTLVSAFAFIKSIKKLPVLSGVCDGFIGNRIMSAYRKQAEYLLEDGSLPYEIDNAMKEFGFAMGIFEMQDLAGLDIGYATRQRKAKTRDPNERYVDIADKIFEMGRLGRKSGHGFYDYSDGKTPEHSKIIDELVVSESARKSIIRISKSKSEIMKTLLDSMAEEGTRILSEGIAQSPEAIDVVMVNGFGFPRHYGGPMLISMS
jgi:3-hydroxyacyl-CoA dehydrogenase